uniref:Putative heat shock hsp20 protein n=1 Tax=Ornithodoros turicata TaxID=34597 RepID=A0A2R5L920_9ACAR
MTSLFSTSRLSGDLADLRSRLNDQYSRLDREYRFYENRYQDIRRRLFDGPLKPGGASLTNDPDRFCLRLDVEQFAPDDIEVKTVDNYVIIHGRHGERADDIGMISREFTRKCLLPKDVQPESVKCSLTTDGYLVVEAPKKSDRPPANERILPITILDLPTSSSSSTTTASSSQTEVRSQTEVHSPKSPEPRPTTSKISPVKNGSVSTGAISKNK